MQPANQKTGQTQKRATRRVALFSLSRDSGSGVEMRGIEPRSTAVVVCLLRVYPVKTFYSAPEFATGTYSDKPSLSLSPSTP
jgi:hypothetical protein